MNKSSNTATPTTERLTVKSSELREGDVVLCHGMRCLIDGPVQSRDYPTDGNRPSTVYWQRSLVVNIADVDDAWLVGMTRETTGWPNYTPTGEHRWTIQANDLASWTVEREVAA